jgi:hypothetical protein
MGFLSRFFGTPTPDKFAKMLAAAMKQAGDKRKAVYDKKDFRLRFYEDGKDAGIANLPRGIRCLGRFPCCSPFAFDFASG